MKHILLAAMLAVVTACGTVGGTGSTYQAASMDELCPTSQEQAGRTLTRDQWMACYGDQKEDEGND